jgi:putative transposase
MSLPRNPAIPDTVGGRRSLRLSGSAYLSGAFFVIVCARERRHIFGTVAGTDPPVVQRSPLGDLIHSELLRSSELRPGLTLDTCIVMSNHLHAILWLASNAAASIPFADERRFARLPGSLASVVAGFKAALSKRARQARLAEGQVWQRNYFERVIRNDSELDALRKYIDENPRRWILKVSGHIQ